MARQYFGTDGVRGVVGETLTAELVEQLGKAAALWCGRGRIFVGRDTRASGPELEDAFADGVASAGATAVLAGVLPTPAVALLRLDLGVVISASHNPYADNGIKLFGPDGYKLSDDLEAKIEEVLDKGPTHRAVPGEPVLEPLLEHDPQRLVQAVEHVDRRGVVIKTFLAPVLPNHRQVQIPALHLALAAIDPRDRPRADRHRRQPGGA